MTRARGGADSSESILEKREDFLHAVAKLKTSQLKLTCDVPHVLAGGGEQIPPALGQLLRLGLREVAAVAHDDAVFHPAGERSEQLTIIDRGRGQIKATEPPR